MIFWKPQAEGFGELSFSAKHVITVKRRNSLVSNTVMVIIHTLGRIRFSPADARASSSSITQPAISIDGIDGIPGRLLLASVTSLNIAGLGLDNCVQ